MMKKGFLGLSFLLVATFAGYVINLEKTSFLQFRTPSSVANPNEPEFSIYPYNEAFSLPDRGTSLFDKIFSRNTELGLREYNIPYPFQKFVAQLTEASGGVAPLQLLFPMGRSLQRVAAIAGMKNVPNADPFYRFPRLVLGFDQESLNSADHLNLNLKGRLYIGMNEKAELLEVISYNDEAGRFEYQVVRNYNAIKKPTVVYANRQLCLTCHQNQTPIFSRGPWSESNANPVMTEGMLRVMRSQMGDHLCAAGLDDPFCFDGKDYRYFGAPVAVDISAPQGLDQTTKLGNTFHAYHKMWQRLCSDMECRKQLLRQILLYKLVGQNLLLLTPDLQNLNSVLASRWQKEFPQGMVLPEASVPNRDPLQNVNDRGRENISMIQGKAPAVKSALEQVLALGNIPGEFEPARVRAPMQPAWTSPFLLPESSIGDAASPEPGVARLIAGYAEFFTTSDIKTIDRILISRPTEQVETLKAHCSWLMGSDQVSFTLKCQFGPESRVSFSSFLRPASKDANSELLGSVSQLRLQVGQPLCDPNLVASTHNLSHGSACFQVNNLKASVRREGSVFVLRMLTMSGLSVRLFDGRRLGAIQLPNPKSVTAAVNISVPIINDLAPIRVALESAFNSVNASDKTTGFRRYIDGPALNRNHIMAMMLRFLGTPQDQLFNLTKEMQGLKRVSEAPDDEITQVENLKPVDRALALAMHNCGACHYNRDNVPPAYLGGPTETLSLKDRCQRLATCSSRMLYRLKMWDCPVSDYTNKKSPMPPAGRFVTLNIAPEFWKEHDRKQLFQALQSIFPKAELPAYLISQGLSPVDATNITSELQTLGCESRLSEIFEKLPRCDKDLPLNVSECLQ